MTRDGTAEPVSRDQILRREHGHGDINFPRLADHEQVRQHYPVDPYYCYMCGHIYIHTNRRYFQHAHFIPVEGLAKRGAY